MGRASTGDRAKRTALDLIVEHVIPGRTAGLRAPSKAALRATVVVRLPIAEVSAKVGSGGVVDADSDSDLRTDVWAGVLPLAVMPGDRIIDESAPGADLPAHVRNWRRQGSSLLGDS